MATGNNAHQRRHTLLLDKRNTQTSAEKMPPHRPHLPRCRLKGAGHSVKLQQPLRQIGRLNARALGLMQRHHYLLGRIPGKLHQHRQTR